MSNGKACTVGFKYRPCTVRQAVLLSWSAPELVVYWSIAYRPDSLVGLLSYNLFRYYYLLFKPEKKIRMTMVFIIVLFM